MGAAVSAGTYIKMDKNANAGAADGKVKVELGDDPNRTGDYSFGFTIYNLKDAATSFNLSADFFTQNVFANQFEDGSVVNFEDTWTTDLTSNVTWTVDGQMVEMTAPEGLANCDFNGDGKVTKPTARRSWTMSPASWIPSPIRTTPTSTTTATSTPTMPTCSSSS